MNEKLQSWQNISKWNKFCQNRVIKIDQVFDPFYDTIRLIKEQQISVKLHNLNNSKLQCAVGVPHWPCTLPLSLLDILLFQLLFFWQKITLSGHPISAPATNTSAQWVKIEFVFNSKEGFLSEDISVFDRSKKYYAKSLPVSF